MNPAIIKRSILRETIPSFLVNILVFTFILLMARVVSLADLIVNKGVSTTVIGHIFILIMPKMLSMSIPMAALLAVLTTFLRMSADSEITVLKASGLSLYQLLPPVFVFGLTAAILTGIFNIWLAPRANIQFRTEILALAKARADLAIKEQIFVKDFPGLMIFVGQIPNNSEIMSNIVINDRRSPGENTIIIAQTGLLDIDMTEELLLFRLENGVIDRIHNDKDSVDSIFFDTYELKLSPGSEFDSSEDSITLGRSEIPTGQLRAESRLALDKKNRFGVILLLEWHRRIAFSCAALIMAVIGLPLGASFRTRERNFGLVIGLLIFIIYYAMFSLGWTLGDAGKLPPGLAIWSSNVLSTATAIWLLKGLNRSTVIDPGENFRRFLMRRKLKKINCSLPTEMES